MIDQTETSKSDVVTKEWADKNVQINFSFEGDFQIMPSEIWPDGDFPEEITADLIVNALVAYYGPADRIINEYEGMRWGAFDAQIDVKRPNPHWRDQDQLLPGGTPTIREQKEVPVR